LPNPAKLAKKLKGDKSYQGEPGFIARQKKYHVLYAGFNEMMLKA